MNRKWLTWAAKVSISAVLTITTMGLARAGQNDNNQDRGRSQHDQNRRDNQGTDNHTDGSSQGRGRNTPYSNSRYRRSNARSLRNRRISGSHGASGYGDNNTRSQRGNSQNRYDGNGVANQRNRSASDRNRATSDHNGESRRQDQNGQTSHSRDHFNNNGGDQH